MKIDYDKRFDTLYVILSDNSNSYGDDMTDNIIMRDINTDEITGITILCFLRKYKAGTLTPLPENIGFSIEKDIIPKLLFSS